MTTPLTQDGSSSREILNVDEAAEFLGFSAYTLREKARDGEIPGRKVGREWRFSRRQLLEWIEAGGEKGERWQRGGNVRPLQPTPTPKRGKRAKVTRLV